MTRLRLVAPPEGTAAERCGHKAMRGSHHVLPIGEVYGLVDGTVLFRPEKMGPDIEVTPAQARKIAEAFGFVAVACEAQQKRLDGRMRYVCWHADGQTWVRHDGQVMALRRTRIRPKATRSADPNCIVIGGKTQTVERPCAGCRAELTGDAWIRDRSAERPGADVPRWWRIELCNACVTERWQEPAGTRSPA